MKKKYYAVAYANAVRYSHAVTAADAALQAYGIVDADRMTVREFPGNPKYAPNYKKKEFMENLAKRHKEKTGNDLG